MPKGSRVQEIIYPLHSNGARVDGVAVAERLCTLSAKEAQTEVGSYCTKSVLLLQLDADGNEALAPVSVGTQIKVAITAISSRCVGSFSNCLDGLRCYAT